MARLRTNISAQPAQADQAKEGAESKPEVHKPHSLRQKIEMFILVLIVITGGVVLGVTAGGISRTGNQTNQKSEHSANWTQDWNEEDSATQPELGQYLMQPIPISVQDNQCTISLALIVRQDKLADIKPLFLRNAPHLKNWLIKYFASLTVEQTRGTASRDSLRNDIRRNFNRIIWPGEKGFIERIDFIQAPRFD